MSPAIQWWNVYAQRLLVLSGSPKVFLIPLPQALEDVSLKKLVTLLMEHALQIGQAFLTSGPSPFTVVNSRGWTLFCHLKNWEPTARFVQFLLCKD